MANIHAVILLCLLHITNCQLPEPEPESPPGPAPEPGGGGGDGKFKGPPPDYSTDLETQLRNELFNGYSLHQRPARKVVAKVSMNLMSINYLDIKDQCLSTSTYFALSWFDSRLRWIDNENYTNIPFLFSCENQMWRPAFIIENSVDNIDVISRPNVPMRIIETGLVIWTPGGVHVTHCESDITYYPLDTQTCHIILSTWAYTAGEVFLVFDETAIGLEFFKEHGEWDLIDTKATVETAMREKTSFSRLKFTLTIRRRPLFHMLNTLFPVVLMAFLTVIVFKLPPESGERVGLSLTILLAFAVYLTLISESIPQTSMSASLLSTVDIHGAVLDCDLWTRRSINFCYFTRHNFIVHAVSVRMHSEGVSLKTISKGFIPDKLSELSKPLPDKIREVIAFGGWYGSNVKSLSTYLASILLLQTFAVILTVVVLDLYFSPEDKPLPGYLQSVIRVLSCNCCKSHSAVVTPEPDTDYYDSQRSEKKSLRRSVASIDGWISPSPTPSTMSCGPLGWKEAARVLDRAFLYLYLIAVIAITGVCMGIMWWHFNADYH